MKPICSVLVLLLSLLSSTIPVAADDSEEIMRIKESIESLQARLTSLEAKQRQQAALVPSKPASEKKPLPAVKFTGYMQGQYLRDSGEGLNLSELDVRRGRFKVDAQVTDRAAITLQTEMNMGISLRDAYLDLGMGRMKLRAGQFKVPLGYQILESSSVRLTPERALVNLRSVPGERDRGLLFDVPVNSGKHSPVVQFGAFNGRGISQAENNTAKDLVAAIHFPNKPVSGRLSVRWGRYDNPTPPAGSGTRVTKLRWGGDLQYAGEPWNVQIQYLRGRGDNPTAGGTISNGDVAGGYVQVAHHKSASKLSLFGRYQWYDPNGNRGGNSITGPLIGLAYDPLSAIRYVIALERLNTRSLNGDRTILTLRTQVKW